MNEAVLQTKKELGSKTGDLYGIFFEDINHAADGGLYAEMIQNRSFEFASIDNPKYSATYGWKFSTPQKVKVATTHPLNRNNLHYLVVNSGNDQVRISNEGFNHGLFLEANKKYNFSIFIFTNQVSANSIKVSLEDENDELLMPLDEIKIDHQGWHKYELQLVPHVTTHQGKLLIGIPQHEKVALDMISLFPDDTFKHRKNGVRKDLGETLADLHPKFMRFPGGCLTHDGSLDKNARDSMYRWKNTIGPVEARPARRNNWGYNQTLGLGFYEYFQFCEDIGAKPLPVLPAGYNPHRNIAAPIDQLQEWIDDALDLIEFANGDVTTKWGKKRAELGHPKPFNLEYIAIGNEEVGQGFWDRYPYFHRAIKAKYPNIKIISTSGPFASGGEFERGWKNAKKYHSDLVDEHYYMSPEWLLANQHRYDSYDSNGPKVFLGEYSAKTNQWFNVVVEASYMLGLERNADKVGLACYAPLLCNDDYHDWNTDLIYFNQYQVSPSLDYYIQKFFMHYQGTNNVKTKISGLAKPLIKDNSPLNGNFGIEADSARVRFSNVMITDQQLNKQTHYSDGLVADQQKIMLGSIESPKYAIDFDAIKISDQNKGLHLIFGQINSQYYRWCIGGWENQDSSIDAHYSDNTDTNWNQYRWSMEPNHKYHFRLEVDNRTVTTYIDGHKYNHIEIKPTIIEPLYFNMTYDQHRHEYYLKLVNVTDKSVELNLGKAGLNNLTFEELTANIAAANEIGMHNKLQVRKGKIINKKITVKPYSVNVVISKE